MANKSLSYQMIDLPLFIQLHMMKMQLETRLTWHPLESKSKTMQTISLHRERREQIEHKRIRFMSEL